MKKRAISIFLCLLMVFQLFSVVVPFAAADDSRIILRLKNYGIGYSVADARLVDSNNPDAELGTVGDFTFSDVAFSPSYDYLEDSLAKRFDSNHVFGPGGCYLIVKARFNGNAQGDIYSEFMNIFIEHQVGKPSSYQGTCVETDDPRTCYLVYNLDRLKFDPSIDIEGYSPSNRVGDAKVTVSGVPEGLEKTDFTWEVLGFSSKGGSADEIKNNLCSPDDIFDNGQEYYFCLKITYPGGVKLDAEDVKNLKINVGTGKKSFFRASDTEYYVAFALNTIKENEMSATLSGYEYGKTAGDINVTSLEDAEHGATGKIKGVSTNGDSIDAIESSLLPAAEALGVSAQYYLTVEIEVESALDLNTWTAEKITLKTGSGELKGSKLFKKTDKTAYVVFELPRLNIKFNISGYEVTNYVNAVKVTGPGENGGTPMFWWSYGGLVRNADSFDSLLGSQCPAEDHLKRGIQYYAFVAVSIKDEFVSSTDDILDRLVLSGAGKAKKIFRVEDSSAYYVAFELPKFAAPDNKINFSYSGYKTGNKVSDVKATVPGTGKGGQFNFIGLSTSNKNLEDLQNHHITSETETLEFGKVYYLCFSVASIRKDFVLNQVPLEEFNLVDVGQATSFYIVEDDPKAGYLCFRLPLLEMKSMSFTYSGYEYGKTSSDIRVNGQDIAEEYGITWKYKGISKSNESLEAFESGLLAAKSKFPLVTDLFLGIEINAEKAESISSWKAEQFTLDGVGTASKLFKKADGKTAYVVFDLSQHDLPDVMKLTIDEYRTGRKVGDVKVTVPDISFSEKYSYSFVPVGLSTSMESIEEFEANREKDNNAALKYKTDYYLGVNTVLDPSAYTDLDVSHLTAERFLLEGYGNPAKIIHYDTGKEKGIYLFFKLPQIDLYDLSFSFSGYARGEIVRSTKIDSPNGDKIKYANNLEGTWGEIIGSAYSYFYGITTNTDSPEAAISNICGKKENDAFLAGETYYLYIMLLYQDGYASTDFNWSNVTLDGVGIADKIFFGKTDEEGAMITFKLPVLTADPISFDISGYELGAIGRNVRVTTNDSTLANWEYNGYYNRYVIATDVKDENSILNSTVGFDNGALTNETLNAETTYYLVIALRKDTGFLIDGLTKDLITLNGVGKAGRLIHYTDEENSDNNCVYACFRLPSLSGKKTINFSLTGYELDAFVKDITVSTEDAAEGADWSDSFLEKSYIATDVTDFESLVKSLCGVDLSVSAEPTDERFEKNKKYYLVLNLSKNTGFIPYALQPKDVVLDGFGEACKIIEYSDSNNEIAYVCFELPELFKTYTVSFNANGGSGSMASVTAKEGEFALPGCTFTAPKGKQFKGWSMSADGAVIDGASVEVLADTVLYAVWETHDHEWSKWTAVDAESHTRSCACGENETKAHTVVTDKAVAATCTEDGLTEGKHCSDCNTVLVKQETVKAKGHTVVIDKAVAATCTEDGLTKGKHCSVCNTVLVKQETVKAKGHTVVTDKAVAATCTEDGLTEGKHCSDCNTVLVKQETVKAKGHNYQNGECTDCGEKQQQHDDGGQKNCSHICHKSGFAGFIWKIAKFFCKLFKINPVCSCGAKHY